MERISKFIKGENDKLEWGPAPIVTSWRQMIAWSL
jgi:hypothetical protein